MDIQMPVMNGYETTGKLRETGAKRPIAALSTHAMEADEAKCIEAGCEDYLSAPMGRTKLIDVLNE